MRTPPVPPVVAVPAVATVAAAALVVAVGARPARPQSAGASASPPAVTQPAAARADAFVGGWTLNKDLSDQLQGASGRGDGQDGTAGRRGDGGGIGGRRGGFGGRRRGGAGNGGAAFDPQQAERQREALRDIMNPPDHLTIVTTESMLILTGPDGRTLRLSPDGRKIKDESTNVERKTRWDGDRLVSEIGGLAGARITETYSVDAEPRHLRIVTAIEGGRGGAPRTMTHVYDPDAR